MKLALPFLAALLLVAPAQPRPNPNVHVLPMADTARVVCRWNSVPTVTSYRSVVLAGTFNSTHTTTGTADTVRIALGPSPVPGTCTVTAVRAGEEATSSPRSFTVPARAQEPLEAPVITGVDVDTVAAPPPPPPPPPDTTTPDPSWPLQPAGGTVTVDMRAPFTLPLPNQVAGPWDYSDFSFRNLSIVQGNLRWTYPQGFEGGTSPLRAVINQVNTHQFARYYVGVLVRYSQPWTRHPNADKILYWGEMTLRDGNPGVQAGQAYIGRVGNATGATIQASQTAETCPRPNDTARNFPCAYDAQGFVVTQWIDPVRIDDGQWHRIEVIATGSTNGQPNGGFAMWVDGRPQWAYTNVVWSPLAATRFYGINLDPVWGGGEGVFKPGNEWMEIGALRVSGR